MERMGLKFVANELLDQLYKNAQNSDRYGRLDALSQT